MNPQIKPKESCDLTQALYTYALELTGNHHHAKELLQQTTARIKQVATLYTPITSFTTWTRMVMENTFYTTFKNADIETLRHTTRHCSPSPMQPERDKEYTLKEQIHMMSLLTPHQAAATTLRLNHYTHNAIARRMSITTTQVKNHLTRALRTLNHAWDS